MSYFENIRTFTRIYELGSMSAAARDQRISPAVASARISQLEGHLGVSCFNEQQEAYLHRARTDFLSRCQSNS